MTEFRTATERDVEALVSVALRAYPAPPGGAETVRQKFLDNPWGGFDDLWIGEADGRQAAHAFLYAYTLHAFGREWAAGGVGSVAVAPDARRRGWARRILRHCQNVCREREWPLCLLYPFRVDFYRSLGWGVADVRDAIRSPMAALPDDTEGDRCRTRTLAELDDLLPVYDRFARKRNGFLKRDAGAWMKVLLRRPPFLVVHEGTDGLDGYAFYRMESMGEHPLHQRLHVLECVWTTDAAWRGLWAFVRRQADQAVEVAYDAHEWDGFVHFLTNPGVPGGGFVAGSHQWIGEKGTGIMVKVVDPRAVAAGRTYGAGEGALAVSVHDPLTEETARFRLDVADGRARVSDGSASETLETDATTWSQLQCGALTLAQAIRFGRVSGTSDAARWTDILAAPPWGTFDGF